MIIIYCPCARIIGGRFLVEPDLDDPGVDVQPNNTTPYDDILNEGSVLSRYVGKL